ncbi:hypothetical protein ACOMHN_049984 [Nucella lapillus]
MPKKKPQKLRVTAESESDLSDDEIQEYHKQKDKILLDSDFDDADDSEEQEVYGLGESSDSDDEGIAQMQQQMRQIKRNKVKKKLGSDLEDDTEDEAVPDTRAWGNKKSWFMGGDVRDNKIILSGSEDEAGAAALEELELRKLRERRLEQLTEEDYFPPHLMAMIQKDTEKKEKKQKKRKAPENDDEEAGSSDETKKKMTKGSKKKKSSAEGETGEVEKIKFQTDLSEEAEYERLKEMHPEFFPLFEDFKSKMHEFRERVIPLMGLVRKGNIDGMGATFIKMKYHILTNYLICGGFYMYYLGKKTPRLHHHPVMKRLLEFQQFYNRLVPTDERVKPELDNVLELARQGKEVGKVVCTQGESSEASASASSKKARKAKAQETPAGSSKNAKDSLGPEFEEEEGGDFDETQLGNLAEAEDGDGPGRRAITKEMEKNKGLTAHKKKGLKNPRVKHRKKYRRALIRRKGQVRDYKPPKTAYSGEMTGIRTGIIRSRKLK